MKWKFTLINGTALRQIIDNGGEDLESCKKTLSALEKCYQEIKNRIDAAAWREIRSELETIQEHIQIFNKDEINRIDNLQDLGFDGYNPYLDCVNEDLEIFYDICDSNRIWVGGI